MPAESAPDEVKSIALEVVERPPRRNPWRPTVLTMRKFLKICHLVEKGFAISRACEVECITYARFRQRVQQSARLQERLKEAEATRFNWRQEQALESIMAAGEKSWMAHAWFLERSDPARWALKNVSRPEESLEPEEELPAEVLKRHRQLMLQMAKEDEAEEQAKLTQGEA